MGKGRRNQRNTDYFKVQGGAVEDRDIGRAAKQKVSGQKMSPKKKKAKRAPSPAEIHPATPRRIKPAAKKKVPPQSEIRVNPEENAPNTFAGAALSRLSGMTRRVVSAAEWGVGALRWAGHMIQTARGKGENTKQ
jgi:hypothetical protein